MDNNNATPRTVRSVTEDAKQEFLRASVEEMRQYPFYQKAEYRHKVKFIAAKMGIDTDVTVERLIEKTGAQI